MKNLRLLLILMAFVAIPFCVMAQGPARPEHVRADLAKRYLQEHPEHTKLFSFHKQSNSATCSDEKVLAAVKDFGVYNPDPMATVGQSDSPTVITDDQIMDQAGSDDAAEPATTPKKQSATRSRPAR